MLYSFGLLRKERVIQFKMQCIFVELKKEVARISNKQFVVMFSLCQKTKEGAKAEL